MSSRQISSSEEVDAFFEKVGSSIEYVRSATELNWYNRSLTDADCQIIVDLATSGSLSHTRRISLVNNCITDKGISDLIFGIASSQVQLDAIFLGGNYIGDAGLTALVSVCLTGSFSTLTALDLTHNKISDVGVMELVEGLGEGILPQLAELSLYSNQIGAEGVDALATACAQGVAANLRTIFISHSSHESLNVLVEACRMRCIDLVHIP